MENFSNVLKAFDKHQRDAVFAVLACTSMAFIIFFFLWEEYRDFEWYVQGVFALGASVAWVSLITASVILNFKEENPYFYFCIILLAFVTVIVLVTHIPHIGIPYLLIPVISLCSFCYTKRHEKKEKSHQPTMIPIKYSLYRKS